MGVKMIYPQQIDQAYQDGTFYYQFLDRDGGRSRIMRCDNESERDWLARQVRTGATVIVRPAAKLT
jgi:hypothetical protein